LAVSSSQAQRLPGHARQPKLSDDFRGLRQDVIRRTGMFTIRLGSDTTGSAARRCGLAADPPNADVRRGTETIRELRTVMLDVTDVHKLMLQLRHAVPTETALHAVEIERVHRVIDHAIAERPILKHLRLCIWVALDTVIVASMLRPPLKRCFVSLQIQVRKEQRVIRHLPERVLVIGIRPLVCRTALDGLTQHRERSVVLALENGSEPGIRHGASYATSDAIFESRSVDRPSLVCLLEESS
jgi:hypothetical protein